MSVTDRVENSCTVGAIRQGMIMMIPLLVVGYISLMIVSLPIPAFQDALSKLFGGFVKNLLNGIYASVNDFFSVFLAVATSVSYAIMKQRKKRNLRKHRQHHYSGDYYACRSGGLFRYSGRQFFSSHVQQYVCLYRPACSAHFR